MGWNHAGDARVRAWVLVALLALPSMAAASASPLGAATTFRIGVTSPVDSLNPLFMSFSAIGSWLQDLTYDSLIRTSPASEVAPELADHWEVSTDGLTWTFHLRDGVRWSDGVPLTAQDVAWTAKLMMSKGMYYSDGTLDATASVTAVDDRTVAWVTKRPTGVPAASGYAALILPEHVFGAMRTKALLRTKNYPDPVVSGPFTISQWDERSGWTLQARPDYWAGQPAVDQIVVKVYGSNAELANGLQAGEVDYARFSRAGPWVPPSGDGLVTSAASGGMTLEIAFNLSQDGASAGGVAVRDVAVRRAISSALDRQALSDQVVAGFGAPDTSVIPALDAFWRLEPPPGSLDPAPEAAAQGLETAGYRDANGDGIREMPSGGPLHLRLPVDASDPIQVKAAAGIIASLARIGIDLQPEYLSSEAFFNTIAYQDAGYGTIGYRGSGFDLFLNEDYSGSAGADPGTRLKQFVSGPCLPYSTCFSDHRYDQLYQQQAAETDRDARRLLLLQMQQIIANELPVAVLVDVASVESWRADRWSGLERADPPSRGPALIGGDYSAGNATAAMMIRSVDAGPSTTTWTALILFAAGFIAAAVVISRRRATHDAPIQREQIRDGD